MEKMHGQQGLTGSQPHSHQDPGPEIGHLDATDAELVVQPAGEVIMAPVRMKLTNGKSQGRSGQRSRR